MSENRTVQAFSKNVKHAEKYLREEHPEALIPPSLLKDSIRESFSNEDDAINPLKGEPLGLGVVNKIRGRLGQLFLAFPTTESFSTVGKKEALRKLISRNRASRVEGSFGARYPISIFTDQCSYRI